MSFAKLTGPLCAVLCLVFAPVLRAEETNATAVTPVPQTVTDQVAGAKPAIPPTPPNPPHEHSEEVWQVFKDTLVPVAFFGMIVSIVGIWTYAAHRKNRMLHETLRALIEKGQPISPELLEQLGKRPRQPSADLGRGLVLIALGFGLALFLYIKQNENWGVGAIPLLMGIAHVIAWKIDSKKRRQA